MQAVVIEFVCSPENVRLKGKKLFRINDLELILFESAQRKESISHTNT